MRFCAASIAMGGPLKRQDKLTCAGFPAASLLSETTKWVDAVNAKVRRPDYLFLDCEWADVTANELVSIGVASIDGERSFYAEIDVLPPDPTPGFKPF